MLSSLIAISALIQFAFITRLSLLRRIITPTVAGTVLMLMSATIISVVLGRLPDIPKGAPMIAGAGSGRCNSARSRWNAAVCLTTIAAVGTHYRDFHGLCGSGGVGLV